MIPSLQYHCARCKKFLVKDEVHWFGSFSFCAKCFAVNDFDCYKKYFSYDYYDKKENPTIIMPQLLEKNITAPKYEDTIIKEYIPLEVVVCELETVSEKVECDKHNEYAYTGEEKTICVNPLTGKFYLKSCTTSGTAFPRYGDHFHRSESIIRQIDKSELSNEILKKASRVELKFSSYNSYIEEFPSFSTKNNAKIQVTDKFDEVFEYFLPDKLYCCDFDFDNGAEYCYLRRVNGEYRLFYLKRFCRKYYPIIKECSEEFITSVFEQIDSMNENPLDARKHKGDHTLFGISMPVLACDRKLTENECRAISLVFSSTLKESVKHGINGFYALLQDDDFKIVKLVSNSDDTKLLYTTLVNIAKYGI